MYERVSQNRILMCYYCRGHETGEAIYIEPSNHFCDENGGNKPVDYNELYKEHYPKVYRHIVYLTGNPQTAEDLSQEVFLRLYNNPPGHENVAAWLFKVANNLSYNHLRDEKARGAKEPAVSADEEDKVISIEDIAIKNQEIREIRKVLALLPERDRMCLLLKFSGYRYSEIAEVIGVEKTSVGTILARSQAKFIAKFI